jgi:two-component system nitrogen regulation response regulator GlnG
MGNATVDESEDTLSFPLPVATHTGSALLAVTVLWHPDPWRAGEQFIGPAGEGEIGLSRFAPLFGRPGEAALALGHRSVAREATVVRRDAANGLHITPPRSRMALEVNGVGVSEPVYLRAEQVDAGVVLRLGGMILLCLHWMRRLPGSDAAHGLLGVSSGVIAVRRAIAQVARTDLPVLLLGETGTGKEVVARAIHAASVHRSGPWVTVNMATLNEALAAADLFGASKGAYTGALAERRGLFTEAAGGTLFLDEIGDTPVPIQPMLLRVLETGEYRPVGASRTLLSQARLIAATDQDLDGAAGVSSFNQPLLRRLEAFVIRLPPLRERREDMGLLIAHFAQAYAGPDAAPLPCGLVSDLCNYNWPGNIRQLANVLRRALIALQANEAPTLQALVGPVAGLPPPARSEPLPPAAAPGRRPLLAEIGDRAVLDAMEQNGWRIRGAALTLGISRPSLYKLLAAHPQIRAAQAIGRDELEQALQCNGGDLERAASALKTPSEPLRRHLRQLGLLAGTAR